MYKQPVSPLQYLYENRFVLVRAMFFIWLLFAIYWLYSLWGIECAEIKCLKFAYKLKEGDEEGISARSALAFILWVFTSGIFVAGAVIFILKFLYNCVMDMIKGVVSRKTQDFVVPIVLMVSLWPCFAYRMEIKSAYRTLSSQASEIVTMALGYNLKLERGKTQGTKSRVPGFSDEKEPADEK
ncbi:hypothetical protein [Candidatus Magnetominusculus dajiuhuensis]|uniref:hypothetical protein n=1 Tax=Candidatus Magnetominusculus dajiuhuensis TaxID=3137712 RepID=UPI003B432B59